ncbi:small-conductance mechanosensitive channel [Gillisia mitskevichiae]|uniref:Small-conductance mechanosensitive channel n=1 Tax=Gillisia mitskevichiae TaxID=270921 RepID=A0A495PS00_9FLAO|nr:mechanosensitive ion channel domain-containing protein [Gillisia mitskevichiae]RKS53331.1 small-conductance mechanosensitive channel [Gillisia mitskevichiae]
MYIPTLRIWFLAGLMLIVQNTFAIQSQKDSSRTENQNSPKKSLVLKDTVGFDDNPIMEYSENYYIVNQLNKAIGLPPNKYNFTTPQATLEHFIVNSRNKRFQEASHALNFNLLSDYITKEDAATIAEKLYFIMNQRVGIAWDDIPDRPDGQVDITTPTNKVVAGKPRRSISFGKIDLEGRDIVFRLQRLKFKDRGPIWLISSQTVENIEPLYKVYGPRRLDEIMPGSVSFELFGVPFWKYLGTIFLMLLSYLIARLFAIIIRKIFSNSDIYWLKDISNKLSSPAGSALGILLFYILLNKLISFSGPLAQGIYAVLLLSVIIIFTWLVMRIIDYFMDFFTKSKIGDITAEENHEARRMLTYVSVGRRIFIFVIFIIAVSIMISQFPTLEKFGISLMASAGLATLIVGIAAQSTLGNIIAGIQIAITKPVRIGDSLFIKDDYGVVEDIRFTYMVVRTWNLHRKVIPLTDVISESFKNLSMTDAQTLGEIELFADFRIDVGKVRSKFSELLKQSDEWDGVYEPLVEVTEINERTIKMRCLCSAKDFPTTWSLRCRLREELIQYIGELEDGHYLSKQRVNLEKNS